MRNRYARFIIPLSVCFLAACQNPQPGPDKTIGAAVLGAGWGAGAGAVIGHQVSYAGEGAAIGSGFGAVSGALTGLGYDLNESAILDQEDTLAQLRIQNAANAQQLDQIQNKLDRAIARGIASGVSQIFFDVDTTNMKAGSLANLEVIAEQFKSSPGSLYINVVGHSDDTGNPEYNARLAEARARSVSAYLASRGISLDRIKVEHHGSERPLASNATPVGRQLNRRVDVFVSN
ncbi:MAG: OmpA family protein [Deltaproteobacteria bacterium]|nr:OmpA family protein [Deltaproteobacteria bacterium]